MSLVRRKTGHRDADGRLSRAASAIRRYRNLPEDPMGDPSGDCGDLIAAGERRAVLRMAAAAGYATPGDYNAALFKSLGVQPDGLGHMSYRTFGLLQLLEISDVCPACGAALDVTSHRTRAYGGGWDTFYKCPACSWAEVCT